jgi:hypothetical protein
MPKSTGSRIRNLALNLALVLLSTLIAVLIAEIAVRIAGYGSMYAGTQFFQYDPVLGWRLAPNLEGPFERPQFQTYVRINQHGLRDLDRPYEKKPNQKRILVLGDSFVWGYGVNGDQAITSLMEDDLPGVEVINAGVTAYGTAQELLWLEREGLKYHPDLVILVLYKNDLTDNVTPVYNGYHRPLMALNDDGSLTLTGVPCSHGSLRDIMRKWMVRHSALMGMALRSDFRFLLRLEGPIFGTEVGHRGNDAKDSAGSGNDYAVRLTVALVEKTRKAAQEKGARLLVVAVCHHDDPCKEVVKGLTDGDIPTLALDDLKDYSPANMIISGDEHWNAAGHTFVAQAISEFIKKHDLLR